MELLGGPELADLVASLPGFLLAVTREGKLVGVTDNVAQHLGHSMVGTCTWGGGWVSGGCRVLGADPPASSSPPCRWTWWHKVTASTTCWIQLTTRWCDISSTCPGPPRQVGGGSLGGRV